MWVYDDEKSQMVQREITYVPGLYKIFDEILGMFWSQLRNKVKLSVSLYVFSFSDNTMQLVFTVCPAMKNRPELMI